jgi:hypothetical protein
MDFGATCCTAILPPAMSDEIILQDVPFDQKSQRSTVRHEGRWCRCRSFIGALIARRNPDALAGFWEFPGGSASRVKHWKHVCGGSCSKSWVYRRADTLQIIRHEHVEKPWSCILPLQDRNRARHGNDCAKLMGLANELGDFEFPQRTVRSSRPYGDRA